MASEMGRPCAAIAVAYTISSDHTTYAGHVWLAVPSHRTSPLHASPHDRSAGYPRRCDIVDQCWQAHGTWLTWARAPVSGEGMSCLTHGLRLSFPTPRLLLGDPDLIHKGFGRYLR